MLRLILGNRFRTWPADNGPGLFFSQNQNRNRLRPIDLVSDLYIQWFYGNQLGLEKKRVGTLIYMVWSDIFTNLERMNPSKHPCSAIL